MDDAARKALEIIRDAAMYAPPGPSARDEILAVFIAAAIREAEQRGMKRAASAAPSARPTPQDRGEK